MHMKNGLHDWQSVFILFFCGGFRGFLLGGFLMLGSGKGDYLGAVGNGHQAHALSGASVSVDICCGHTDNDAVIGYQQDIVGIVDNLDGGDLAGFFIKILPASSFFASRPCSSANFIK